MAWHALIHDVARCPSTRRGVFADACESFAAHSSWVPFPGWPLSPDGRFRAELVIVGQGPFDTPGGHLRQGVRPSADDDERTAKAWELALGGYLGSRFHRLHAFPLLREVFGTKEPPLDRIFFTEAVCCPRMDGSPLPLAIVAQCASTHVSRVLAEPSVRVVLCLGDDAVLAVTGKNRWEPWKNLHGRVERRQAGPTLVFATHPMAKREGGGVAWSRAERARLAETLREELSQREERSDLALASASPTAPIQGNC